MAAGKLDRKQMPLLFLILLVMIPALAIGSLMLYNFFTYSMRN
jgi:hypothetical protein